MSAPSPPPAPAAPAAAPAPTVAAPASTTPAAAPVETTVVQSAAPAATAPAAQPSRKRALSEKIFGKQRTDDLEKGLKSDDPDAKHKRRLFGFGLLGTILTVLAGLFMMLFTTGAGFVVASYVFPMLACRMHGYNNSCMFNPWDDNNNGIGDHMRAWADRNEVPIPDWADWAY